MGLAQFRPKSLPVSETRRQRIVTVSDAAGGLYTVSGFQEVVGVGEASFIVEFPVRFFELPLFTYGSHVGNLTGAVANVTNGQFPTLSASVVAWHTLNTGPGSAPYYTGASIIVVTTGVFSTDPTASGQIMTVHFEFKGKAMSYLPTGSDVA